jgi:hypothetical protein
MAEKNIKRWLFMEQQPQLNSSICDALIVIEEMTRGTNLILAF